MPKLTVLSPVNHDGKSYEVGDTLTVDDKAQVAQLVDSGACIAKGGKTKAEVAAEIADAAAVAAAQADANAAAEAAAAEAAAQAAAQAT